MEPPEEPDAGEPSEILQSLLIAWLRQQLQDVALRLRFGGLVQCLEFHLLVRGDEADGAECERWLQASVPVRQP